MEQVRSRTADFLKGVALIAMVQLVLIEYFARPAILNGLAGKISLFIGGPPVAPLFLTVMGYYIAHQHHSIRYHVVRGIKLIFLGLFLNITRNAYLLYEIATGKVTQDVGHILLGTDILILAGLSLIVMAFLVKVLRGHVLAYLALIVVFLLLQYVIPPVEKALPHALIIPFFYGKYPQAQFPFIPWFAYVLAGYTFFLFKQFFISDQFKHNKTVNAVLALLSGILLILSLPFGYSVSIRHDLFYHHGILFFLFCVNYLFWWLLSARALINRFQNKTTAYLEFLGRNVTVFYVIFMIIAGNLGVFCQKSENYPMLLVSFVLMMTITSLLVWAWDRIRR